MKLTFITGKGGVGKSAVTAGIAKALASLKIKVGVLELGEARMADFFGSALSDYEGISANPGITLFNLDARSCFEEYASRHLPKRAMLLVKNRWVEHFIDATPGLNEILLLGKIYSLLEEGPWDILLVDAPATGHTISLCDAPRVAFDVLQGPLKETIGKIDSMLCDKKQTGFLLVTQLENFIVEETLELHQHLCKKLQLKPQGIIINGMLQETPDLIPAIPESYPPVAKPLVKIVDRLEEKRGHQKNLLESLQKSIPTEYGLIARQEETADECELMQKISSELRPWLSQHFWKKRG